MGCFPIHLKNRYYFPGGGILLPGLWVLLFCLYFSESDPEKILSIGAVTPWFFLRVSSNYCALSSPKKSGHLVQLYCDFYSRILKLPSIIKPKKMWASGTVTMGFFLWVSNDWSLLSTEIFEINMSFEYVLDYFILFSEGLSSREKIVL